MLSAPRISEAQRKTKLDGVLSNTILNDNQKIELKDLLKGLVNGKLNMKKNDYVDDNNRGTVDYDENVINYSKQRVEIPNGTTIRGKNFSQVAPFTDAITGNNLTFINCNLVNVNPNPTWTLIGSNNRQIRKTIDIQGATTYEVQEVFESGSWVEVSRDDITPIN